MNAKTSHVLRRAALAAAACTAICANAAAFAADVPANALVLFGAHWCAPCHHELTTLPAIVAAAGAASADRVVLAWIDRPVPLAETPGPVRVMTVAPAIANAWAQAHLGMARGLPFAVLTDAAGRACGLHKGPLAAADIAALRAQCAGSRP